MAISFEEFKEKRKSLFMTNFAVMNNLVRITKKLEEQQQADPQNEKLTDTLNKFRDVHAKITILTSLRDLKKEDYEAAMEAAKQLPALLARPSGQEGKTCMELLLDDGKTNDEKLGFSKRFTDFFQAYGLTFDAKLEMEEQAKKRAEAAKQQEIEDLQAVPKAPEGTIAGETKTASEWIKARKDDIATT